MSEEVIISIDADVTAILQWIKEQGWKHLNDYIWTKPDYFKDNWFYTFRFEDKRHAVLFALRWVS
jgi:hypothetical protein